jgi:hypothetical protein
MRSIIKRTVLIAAIIAIFAVSTIHMTPVYSSESTANDKLSKFLSTVVELDLTKYSLVPDGYSSRYPSKFNDLVEEEILNYKLESNESKIDVMSIFYNGQMVLLDIFPQGEYVYSKSSPTDIRSQAKDVIQRYQTYVADGSYLVPMKNLLSGIDELSPTEITDGNVNFQISKNGNNTRIQWIYTENGISMNYKRVDMSFRNNILVSFVDTWNLYSVSGRSVISSEEAVQIALEAAQKCEINIGHEDGEIEIVKPPDLSNALYDVSLTMIPYRNLNYTIPSKIPRDPLTLYPYWQIHFYFNKSIAGNTGIQVGVWGDTSEIVYCSSFGYFDSSGTSNEQNSLEEQKQHGNLNPLVLVAALSLVSLAIISMSTIALRRKNRHK